MPDDDYILDDDDEVDTDSILHHVVNEDGSINFEKLNETAITLTLDELYDQN